MWLRFTIYFLEKLIVSADICYFSLYYALYENIAFNSNVLLEYKFYNYKEKTYKRTFLIGKTDNDNIFI